MKTKAQTRAFLRRHIHKHEEEYGMSKAQAVAVALSEARTKGYRVSKRRM
jgi:UDP-N-acetylmuramyl pentapeptide phosphotransferase/UDP-N-acetylglucosamine-1-phosphate transferase